MSGRNYDADHLLTSDGYVFHAFTGEITVDGTGCRCGTPEPVHQIASYREAVPQLQISLTDACNMGCTYCSFRDRVHADGKPVTMPLQVVSSGVEAHRRQLAAGDEKYSRVDFGLAGETMLVRHLHDEVHRIVEQGLTDSPLSVAWVGPMVTNATLSLAPGMADRLGPPQDISVDGPPEVHDRVRFYTNGRGGTYRDVRQVLDQVLNRHPDMGVSSVLTAYCTDFVMIFRHLFDDIGARNIYMKPVNATHDKEWALNAVTLPAFQQGYADLVDHILSHSPDGILERLLALNSEDFFMRYFYRVKDRGAQVYRCGAGKSGTYLDTNGRLYPCAHFIGKSGWHIGHASTGVDEQKRRQYLDLAVDTREPCRSCSVRYVCGGGCYYQAVLANGDIRQPDHVKCDLIRFLVEQAVRLVATLRERHPEVLDALPAPYGVSQEASTAAPDMPYRPMGRLQPAGAGHAITMATPGRVRGGLVSLRDPLQVTVEWRHPTLRVVVAAPDPGLLAGVRVWGQPLGEGFTMRDLMVRKPGDSGVLLRVTPEGTYWLDPDQRRFSRVPFPPAAWRPAGGEARVRWAASQVDITVDLPPEATKSPALGLNVFVDFAGGGWTALALHEPFLMLDLSARGPLAVTGPETEPKSASDSLNGRMPAALIPLGRWTGLQGNVC